MLHGSVSPGIAGGLKALRERIAKADITESRLDQSINLASWNIREFGAQHGGRHRSEAAIHYIAEIIGQFDLVAVEEVRDNLSDLDRVLRILGPTWRAIFSGFNTDAGGNRERIAYLFDQRAVTMTGLAAEADPLRVLDRKSGEYLPTVNWWRSPYMVSFRSGVFDFVLLAAHIRWGDSEKARIGELEGLATWVDARVHERYAEDKDIILLGDFNIPSTESPLYKAVTSKGLAAPASLLKLHGTNLAQNKRYDQILHYPRYTGAFTDQGGAVDFFANDWEALFPKADFPNLKQHNDYTFEMSDHLPLWVRLNTDVAEEQLDQLIQGRREQLPG
jgi:endonuclease/exonuclease/phosphatase family metal-dependent hydrolase